MKLNFIIITILPLFLFLINGCQDSNSQPINESFEKVGGVVFHIEYVNQNKEDQKKYLAILKKRLDHYTHGNYKLTEEENKFQVEISKSYYSAHFKDLFFNSGKLKFVEVVDRDEFEPIVDLIDERIENVLPLKFYDYVDEKFMSNNISCLGLVTPNNREHVLDIYTMSRKAGILNSKMNFQFIEHQNAAGLAPSSLYLLEMDESHILTTNSSSFNSINLAISPHSGQKVIELEFNDEMKENWKNFTSKNVKKTIAVMLQFEVLSVPMVNSPIENGKVSILLEDEKHLKIVNSLLQNESIPFNTFKPKLKEYYMVQDDKLVLVNKYSGEIHEYRTIQNEFKNNFESITAFVSRVPQLKPEVKSALISDMKNIIQLDFFEYATMHNFSHQQLKDIISNAKKIITGSKSGGVMDDSLLQLEKLINEVNKAN